MRCSSTFARGRAPARAGIGSRAWLLMPNRHGHQPLDHIALLGQPSAARAVRTSKYSMCGSGVLTALQLALLVWAPGLVELTVPHGLGSMTTAILTGRCSLSSSPNCPGLPHLSFGSPRSRRRTDVGLRIAAGCGVPGRMYLPPRGREARHHDHRVSSIVGYGTAPPTPSSSSNATIPSGSRSSRERVRRPARSRMRRPNASGSMPSSIPTSVAGLRTPRRSAPHHASPSRLAGRTWRDVEGPRVRSDLNQDGAGAGGIGSRNRSPQPQDPGSRPVRSGYLRPAWQERASAPPTASTCIVTRRIPAGRA